MTAIGNAKAVQDAKDRRDAELARARREGLEAGRREAEAKAKEAHDLMLEAARAEHLQEIARLDERHQRNDHHIQRGAFWKGVIAGSAPALLIGCLLTIIASALMFSQNERALQAGANVAQGGMTAGLAVDAIREGAGQPETNE